MSVWIICISGFTETRGASSGTVRLWRKLQRFSNPETSIQLRLWDENWKDFAAFVHNESEPDPNNRILVCAYSWGAGYGLRKLAKHLKEHGRSINAAVLCDPVFRSRTLIGRWLALLPGMPIKIPDNVQDVFWLYQKQDKILHGHTPTAEDPSRTWIGDGIKVKATHVTIDESRIYHSLALREATRITKTESNP